VDGKAHQNPQARVREIDPSFWVGRPVLITGHKGFKGAWLSALLAHLGARTYGFGRDSRPRLLYPALRLANHAHREADLADTNALEAAMSESRPEVLFHLAAQPIVLTSYADPLGTFDDNIMGTARVLQAARAANSLKAIVVVTSDKVYRNRGGERAYVETDELGGLDPYSASKAAAEIVTTAMTASYFEAPGSPRIATVRAGNVIGGGDWADNRLLPDAARAFEAGAPLIVRNPESTRPWQHVLDPLRGYLMLAERLASSDRTSFDAWNFGPDVADAISVARIVDLFTQAWGQGAGWVRSNTDQPAAREAAHLSVDSSRARRELGWQPRWRVEEAVRRTAAWYHAHAKGEPAQSLVERDIRAALG
jgi:CDP-glucose 4,6-dehydratase